MDLGEEGSQWEGGQREEWGGRKLQLECIESNKKKHFKSGTRAAVATGMGVGFQQTEGLIVAEGG